MPGFILAALICVPAISVSETPDPPVPLFAEKGLLEMEIRAPWRQLQRKREEEGPFPATLHLDGVGEAVELTVEKRGISRQEICDMPPIRLRFDEDSVEDTLFAGNRSIKLVSYCSRGSRWEQYNVLEFVAYRLYNELTELSFRVRPVMLSYFDTERDRARGPYFGFLIEDDRLVGNRHGLDKVEVEEILPSDLPPDETSLFFLFQYMIGNVDFSPLESVGDECCHNVELIGEEDTLEPLFAVPYDFDSSGWVDAHYALAPEQLGLFDIRQRKFRGFCVHDPGLQSARERMLASRDALFAIVESEDRLSKRNRRKAVRYLEGFFEDLEDDRLFERRISGACRSG